MTDRRIDAACQIQTTLEYGESTLQDIDNQIQEPIIMKKELLVL